jgi:hypothetical protein
LKAFLKHFLKVWRRKVCSDFFAGKKKGTLSPIGNQNKRRKWILLDPAGERPCSFPDLEVVAARTEIDKKCQSRLKKKLLEMLNFDISR